MNGQKMPTLDLHQDQPIKLILEGDSGTGKTGALPSLLYDNYKLWIMDFDNGVDIIRNILRAGAGRNAPAPQLLKQVNAVTLTDKFRVNGARITPVSADAWSRGIGLLSKWETFGSIEAFGPQDILVIDSLNFAGQAAMRYIQQLNNRLSVPPQIQDYRDGQILLNSLCQMLYSDSIKCNVICLTHLREVGKREDIIDDKGRVRTIEDPASIKSFPETGTGRALSPTIGRFFNAVLLADVVGTGQATRRIIRTQPHLNIGLKNSSPGTVKSEYPLETGLAEYFRAIKFPVKTPSETEKTPNAKLLTSS